MMASGLGFAFPVLKIFRSGFLGVARDRAELEATNALSLKNRSLEGMLLIDASGQAWRTLSVGRVGNRGWFGGWTILGQHRIRIDMDLAEDKKVDLHSLFDLICATIDKKAQVWSSGGEPADLQERVRGESELPALL